MADSQSLPDIALDLTSLYQEDTLTDRKVGTLRVLRPVTTDGQPDATREVVYEGQASLMTPGGALPLSFEIDAQSVTEALEHYPAAAKKSLEDMMEQMEEMRRRQQLQQSSLLVPGQGGGMGGGAGSGGSGIIM